MINLFLKRDAICSPCGMYRYYLIRSWNDDKLPLCWIMLNPSTADAYKDDPTIRRCMSFAHREGAGGIEVLNLYAYRSSSPKDLSTASDPIGPDNDKIIQEVLNKHSRVVCAWGSTYSSWQRVATIMDLCRGLDFICLGRTAAGHPKHPLYLSVNQPLIPWAI